jgi:hypothetical protein
MALAALFAAGVSIGLALAKAEPDSRAAAETTVRGHRETVARGDTKYARIEGPVRVLAPAGDPAGEDVGSSSALCPSGSRAVSGGYELNTGGGEVFYNDALAQARLGWAVGAANKLARSGMVQAVAYCFDPGEAGTAGNGRKHARQRASARRELEALIDRYRALRKSQGPAAGGL